MTAWFAFVVAQTWLVRSRDVTTHRRFGLFGAALGGAVIATGLYTLAKFAPRAASTQFDPARAADILVGNTLNILVIFPALLGAGIWFRNRPQTHRRLMLLATVSIIDASVLRWPIVAPLFAEGGRTISGLAVLWLITDLPVLVAGAVDYFKSASVHAAYVWGGSALVASQAIKILILQVW